MANTNGKVFSTYTSTYALSSASSTGAGITWAVSKGGSDWGSKEAMGLDSGEAKVELILCMSVYTGPSRREMELALRLGTSEFNLSCNTSKRSWLS